MPDLFELGKTSEEKYFRRKEEELIERLKKKAAAEAHRKGLADAIGLDDHQILDLLQEMGFDHSTVELLFLFPLLQVAWSDGGVSDAERAFILRAARAYGVEEGSAAHERLVGLLKTQPDPVLFERAMTVIKDLLRFEKGKTRQTTSAMLIDACEGVAAASGGFLGLGSKVSAKERDVLRRVADSIGKKHVEAAARVENRLKGE